MAVDYNVDVVSGLERRFAEQDLCRPMRVERYEAGQELSYSVTGVAGGESGDVLVCVEKFVGGGFAGQVYRVEVQEIVVDGETADSIAGVEVGKSYAMKILIPPSKGSLGFRNFVYAVGFQGPFQLQVSESAARAGAIWQKFIRRAASKRFGDEKCVNDIHVTFVDETLGSCGELTDWVDGRTWRLEVDENLDTLKRWLKGKKVDESRLGSDEYRAKKKWMDDFVALLHEIGAHEFARQYEWWTCKSQPNCLKRTETGDDAEKGLIAVDFRAGLALLPFLPMSPGDFKLILDGMKRGSLVQFDRGNLKKLEGFVADHAEDFADMGGLLEKLTECEDVYRNSLPDITHNGIKLFYSGKLWRGMYAGAVNGWKVRNLIDEKAYNKIKTCKFLTTVFWLMGVLSWLGRVEVMAGVVLGIAQWIGPFESEGWLWLNDWSEIWWKLLVCGAVVWQGLRLGRKVWGRGDWREHYWSMLTSGGYFARAIRGRMAESVIEWHRCGRVSEVKAEKLAKSVGFVVHLPMSVLPGWLHRMLTDPEFAKEKLWYIFVRPFALYFNAKLRNEWIRDMISEGRRKHILSDEDAETVTANLKEPYIQRYLVSLVVHMMTAPVTQIVSGIHAWIWYRMHPDVSSAEQAAVVAGILIAYQITPLSPGSFCRGVYTTCLAIYDRNFKDYNIALFLSYFKYLGYLAFPIQMTYRYPAMARFMAGHWATGAVHIVPVFGEQGALFERWVFCLFYNWPLTIRRRIGERIEKRESIKPKYWHVPVVSGALAGLFVLAHQLLMKGGAEAVELRGIWYLSAGLPLLGGALITMFAGGAVLWKRVVAGVASGMLMGLVYTAGAYWVEGDVLGAALPFVVPMIWRVFAFTVFSVIGAILAELVWPSAEFSATEIAEGTEQISHEQEVRPECTENIKL